MHPCCHELMPYSRSISPPRGSFPSTVITSRSRPQLTRTRPHIGIKSLQEQMIAIHLDHTINPKPHRESTPQPASGSPGLPPRAVLPSAQQGARPSQALPSSRPVSRLEAALPTRAKSPPERSDLTRSRLARETLQWNLGSLQTTLTRALLKMITTRPTGKA
jgi:hypothetical protein